MTDSKPHMEQLRMQVGSRSLAGTPALPYENVQKLDTHLIFTVCGSTFYPLLPAFENIHGIVAKSGDQHYQGEWDSRKDLERRLKNIYRRGLEPTKEMLISNGVQKGNDRNIDAQHATANLTRPRHAAIITEEFLFEDGKAPFPSCYASSSMCATKEPLCRQ